MKKRTLIVNKKRFLIFLFIAGLFLFSVFFASFNWMSNRMAYGMTEQEVRKNQSYQKVIVQEGDTVWALAKGLAKGKNIDTRDLVREIYRLNDLGKSTLHPGQPLLIPNI